MSHKSIIVLIGGGHAAGKRTTAELLKQEIETAIPKGPAVELIDLLTYEKKDLVQSINDSLNGKSSAITVNKNANKHPPLKPSRFQFDELKARLSKELETPADSPQKIFIVHGLYALYDKELRELSNIRVFIDSDPDTRLIRWIRRDIINNETNPSTLEYVINYYLRDARVEMNDYIFPTKEFADVIMPRGAESNAVKLIFDGILAFMEHKILIHSERVKGNLRPDLSQERFDKYNYYALD